MTTTTLDRPLHLIAAAEYGTPNVPLLRKAARGDLDANAPRSVWDYRKQGLRIDADRKVLAERFGVHDPRSYRRAPYDGETDRYEADNSQSICPRIVAYKERKQQRAENRERAE